MAFWGVVQIHGRLLRPTRRVPRPATLAEYLFERAGFESYLPKIRERRNGETKISALFPSYAFLHIRERWYDAAHVQGVLKILMHGDHPAKLDDRVIDALRAREHRGFVTLPRGPRPGDRVRILTGQFLGHVGLYLGQSPHERERVLLELLGRSVRVELAQTDRVEGVS
jgi:transcriptional antiterminator RfaH